MLPTAVIIGAQKGGTSSLHHYLEQHPDVGSSSRKEMHFFDQARRPVRRYRASFPIRGRYRHALESTPYYLFHPAVPGRLRAMLPDAKLIVLLRDPVARTYSHYQHSFGLGLETLPFDEAIAAEDTRLAGEAERLLNDPHAVSTEYRDHSYVARSLYAPQIARWYDAFPREQLLILQSEDLFEDPARILVQTQQWLGLEPSVPSSLTARNTRSYSDIDERTANQLRTRFAADRVALAELTGVTFRWN
jgi:hypothetical protein